MAIFPQVYTLVYTIQCSRQIMWWGAEQPQKSSSDFPEIGSNTFLGSLLEPGQASGISYHPPVFESGELFVPPVAPTYLNNGQGNKIFREILTLKL